MPSQTLDTDYLVVGSGAVAMAFVDVIVSETQASVLMVYSALPTAAPERERGAYRTSPGGTP